MVIEIVSFPLQNGAFHSYVMLCHVIVCYVLSCHIYIYICYVSFPQGTTVLYHSSRNVENRWTPSDKPCASSRGGRKWMWICSSCVDEFPGENVKTMGFWWFLTTFPQFCVCYSPTTFPQLLVCYSPAYPHKYIPILSPCAIKPLEIKVLLPVKRPWNRRMPGARFAGGPSRNIRDLDRLGAWRFFPATFFGRTLELRRI